MQRVIAQAGIREPNTVAQWRDLFAFLHAVAGTLACDPLHQEARGEEQLRDQAECQARILRMRIVCGDEVPGIWMARAPQ